jgi:hypothetical protein
MERLRWLPRQPADRVVVNGQRRVRLYRADKVAFTTRVVVGEVDKQTPVSRDDRKRAVQPALERAVLDRYREICRLANNPAYLENHHMQRRGVVACSNAGPGNALGH